MTNITQWIENELDNGFLIDDIISDIDSAMRGDWWQCEDQYLVCDKCEDKCWDDNGESDYHDWKCCDGRHPVWLDCGDCYKCDLYNIVLDMNDEDKEEYKTYKVFI
jgi:hypothetical protein